MRTYRQTPRPAGVYRILHRSGGRKMLGASPDAPAMLNRIRAQSGPGSHPAKQLQKDWDADGEDGFDLEVLDLLAAPDDPDAHLTGELRTMLGSGGRDSGSKRTLTLTGRGRRGCE